VKTTELLLAMLDEAYNRKSWHGANLRGSLRGVTQAEAEWRPATDRHSIRDIVVHAAYWKYRIRRRVTGDLEASFVLDGRDWFATDTTRTFAADLKLLGAEHQRLREAVASMSAARIARPVLADGTTAAYLVRGIAAHDLYHAGQIQLLKRLQRAR
jgi:uncharacterized damage-inducible protein DinB